MSIGQNTQELQTVDEKPAIHKIQPAHGSESLVMVLPKRFISKLQIAKGDYVKCNVIGRQLIVEKIEV
jgi:hypothetical protein